VNDVVPESWPMSASQTPVEAPPMRWRAVLPLLVATPLVPGRLGPRLSRSTWGMVLAAQLVSLLVVTGIVALAIVWIEHDFRATPIGWRHLTLSEWVRLPLALPVYAAYVATDSRGDIYAVFGCIAALHALGWAAALVLMPLIAAGERLRAHYFRCLKLILWSTAGLVPAALLVLAVAYIGTRWGEELQHFAWLHGLIPAIGAGVIWWLSIALRLGARAPVPPEEATSSQAKPRCNECGYIITGLPLDGRCPECGLEVRCSMPEYRRPPPWGDVLAPGGRTRRYLQTAWAVFRRRDFFKRLAVRRNVHAARRFACLNSLGAATVVCLGCLWGATDQWTYTMVWWVNVINVALPLLTAGIAAGLLHFGMTLVALWIADRPRASDLRSRAVAASYASFLLLPGFVYLATLAACAHVAFDLADGISAGYLFGNPYVSWADLVLCSAFALAVVCFVSGFGRMVRAIRAVRFAAT